MFHPFLLFVLLLSLMTCLHILEFKPLLVASFVNIFSQSANLSFHFVYGFLCCEKLVSLVRSHLFIFALERLITGDIFEREI